MGTHGLHLAIKIKMLDYARKKLVKHLVVDTNIYLNVVRIKAKSLDQLALKNAVKYLNADINAKNCADIA